MKKMEFPARRAQAPGLHAVKYQSNSPKIAVAGIGGFAAAHHQALLELELEGILQVTATCDPRAESLGELRKKLNLDNRGIAICSTFSEMLASERYDWVSIATPIGLHSFMHEACVAQGLPCYLEKPPTLDPVELERMIAVDERAALRTQVGFNYVYEPERLAIKRRLLAGEFGRLQRVGLLGAWKRNEIYYNRSSWAGRLQMNGTLLLDSCLGNAMSHHVHNILFFAGTDNLESWGDCEEVEAQLFRANPIEGADTVFARGRLASSVQFRIALTHACEETGRTVESLVCEKATIRITPRSHIQIFHHDGSIEFIALSPRAHLKENFRFFGEYVKGTPCRLMSTLKDCRPFVHLNALAYLSAGHIETVSPSLSARAESSDSGDGYWRISGIEKRLEQFVNTGDFDSTINLAPTPMMPAKSRREDLPRLVETILSMRAHSPASLC